MPNRKIFAYILLLVFSAQAAYAGMQFGNDYYGMMNFMGIGNFGWFMGLGFLGLVIVVLLFVFWLFMLIDCMKRDFRKDIEKIAWVLVLIFLHLLGAVIYYFVVRTSYKESINKKSKK